MNEMNDKPKEEMNEGKINEERFDSRQSTVIDIFFIRFRRVTRVKNESDFG